MADRPHYMIVPGINMTMAKQKIEEEKITGMADMDKVMKGLNCCKNSYPKDCKHCPYEKDCTHDGTCDILVRNAISVIAYQRMEIERLKAEVEKAREEGFTAGQNNVFEAQNEGR